ncbi:hypothetical protein QJS66_06100 [Kocuria rhizophila]|nr:hypothetical protein QJS66_06100 [Kocuria rhizophila]
MDAPADRADPAAHGDTARRWSLLSTRARQPRSTVQTQRARTEVGRGRAADRAVRRPAVRPRRCGLRGPHAIDGAPEGRVRPAPSATP